MLWTITLYLADVQPYPTVLDQLRLWCVVEVEDISNNSLVQEDN